MTRTLPALLLTLAFVAGAPVRVAHAAQDPVAAAARGDADAVATLRDRGPAGLEALLARWRVAGSPDTAAWTEAIDAVAQQRDAHHSQLFWYTDLDAAQAEAARTGRPIVSLRLLGALTEEYSCANSRFFRTVLYTDPVVSAWLRDHVVLHWSSERPAPVITVDYGDGRVMRRTITGNSAHLVLDADARPIDVVPGLYGPEAFVAALDAAVTVERTVRALDAADRAARLAGWHQDRIETARDALVGDLAAVRGIEPDAILPAALGAIMTTPVAGDGPPVAIVPMQYAMSKARVELPLLTAFDVRSAERVEPFDALALRGPSADEWTSIALRHPVTLAAESRALIRAEDPVPGGAGSEEALAVMYGALELAVATDTVRNEGLLHPRIHAGLASGAAPDDFEGLVEWLYADVFATPRSDPWLGMMDPSVYTGLVGGGMLPADAG